MIETLELAGIGALMALLEARRKKLAEEGLFDAARKRKVPFLPEVVGVVTSPTGAVIRDILHRLADRFPVRVVVWPVRVQGETSAAEVAAAIDGFNALAAGGAVTRPDVLIVARGGGSLEDLMSFNDEAVVRAAARSAIPLIAAVGHETDWTLIDHAADMRAPTPTAAAEFAVPVRAELLATVADLHARGRGAILRFAPAPSRRASGALARAAGRRGDRRPAAPAPRPRGGDAEPAGARRRRPAGVEDGGAGAPPRPSFAARPARRSARARPGTDRPSRPGSGRCPSSRPRRQADAAGRAFARERAALARGGAASGRRRSAGSQPAWRAPSANARNSAAPSFSPPGNCSAR